MYTHYIILYIIIKNHLKWAFGGADQPIVQGRRWVAHWQCLESGTFTEVRAQNVHCKVLWGLTVVGRGGGRRLCALQLEGRGQELVLSAERVGAGLA